MNTQTNRHQLEFPTIPEAQESRRVLLHSCCATCAGEVMEALVASNVDVTVFFYNPNIHPHEEYEKRKADNKRFAEKLGIPFVDADYDPATWFERIKGLEHAPERGPRCTACFALRLWRTALYAKENNFPIFATTLGISRWKNLDQVNQAGLEAAAAFPPVFYWPCNWRKDGGADRRLVIARREGFYQQNYCGCIFSKQAREEQEKQRDEKTREK